MLALDLPCRDWHAEARSARHFSAFSASPRESCQSSERSGLHLHLIGGLNIITAYCFLQCRDYPRATFETGGNLESKNPDWSMRRRDAGRSVRRRCEAAAALRTRYLHFGIRMARGNSGGPRLRHAGVAGAGRRGERHSADPPRAGRRPLRTQYLQGRVRLARGVQRRHSLRHAGTARRSGRGKQTGAQPPRSALIADGIPVFGALRH